MPGEGAWLERRLKLVAEVALSGCRTRESRRSSPRDATRSRRWPTTRSRRSRLWSPPRSPGRGQLRSRISPASSRGRPRATASGTSSSPRRARAAADPRDRRRPPPSRAWRTIEGELSLYGAGLDERPHGIVALNKIDLLSESLAFRGRRPKDPRRFFEISCVDRGAGSSELRRALFELSPGRSRSAAAAGHRACRSSWFYRPKPTGRRPLPDLPHGARLPHRRDAAGLMRRSSRRR